MKIKITEIMGIVDKIRLRNTTISKFKQETIHFYDLGYPDKIKTLIYFDNIKDAVNVSISEPMTSRELNKRFKGKTICEINLEEQNEN